MNISGMTMEDELRVDELLNTINDMVGMEAKQKPVSVSYTEFTAEKLKEKGFRDSQIQEIQLGIEHNLPVEIYAKECYNWKQMYEIRMGLLENLDTKIYENPLFSSEQMREIRLGLLDNLDVSSYARLILTVTDMRKMRKQLIAKAYQVNPEGFGRTFTDERSGVILRISDDCMEAFITLPEERNFSVHNIEKILEHNDIVHGILPEQLQKIAKEKPQGVEIKVAQGETAGEGTEGWFEYFFNQEDSVAPTIQEDGKADYTNVIMADKVTPGTVLVKYHPTEAGKPGKTVTGIVIEGSRGKELSPLTGKGFTRDEEKDTYVAAEDGYVSYDEIKGTLNVWNVYVVQGDVNRYNGHISYDGMVHIKGSVSDMAEIEAKGDVIVDGFIEGAIIRAGGNVVIKRGVNAGGQGYIQAGGTVMGNFFEAANIRAGKDVEGNYFLNCHVKTDGNVTARGNKGRIMGGDITAAHAVESVTIGNYGGVKTLIYVGDTSDMVLRTKQLEEEMRQSKLEILQLEEAKDKLRGMLGSDAVEQNDLFQQTCLAIQVKEQYREHMEKELVHLRETQTRARKAYIRVSGKLQEGVKVSINGNAMEIKNTLSGITLTKDKIK